MEKKIKKGVLISTIIIVVLSLVLVFLLFKFVSVKQLADKKAAKILAENGVEVNNKTKNTTKLNDGNYTTYNEFDLNKVLEDLGVNNETQNANQVIDNVTSNIATQDQSNPLYNVGSLGAELDPGDLMMFTDLLNKADYNPFVAQTYSRIEEINFYKIFYTGAGDISTREQNLADEYREVAGYDATLDITKIRVSYIEELLQKRIGKVPDNWRAFFKTGTDKNDLKYSDKYGAYYFEHDDTNYTTVKVVKGFVNGNTYTLIYQGVYSSNKTGTVTLNKQDNGEYTFVSNYAN